MKEFEKSSKDIEMKVDGLDKVMNSKFEQKFQDIHQRMDKMELKHSDTHKRLEKVESHVSLQDEKIEQVTEFHINLQNSLDSKTDQIEELYRCYDALNKKLMERLMNNEDETDPNKISGKTNKNQVSIN